MKTAIHFASAVVLLLLRGSVLFAQPISPHPEFYVSPTGDDSNPGAIKAPWRTIQHAADAATAGSTVNVRAGVYQERVTINASGNASDGYITFRSYPGETAVLDAGHFTPDGRSGVLTIRTRVTYESRALKFGTTAPPNIGAPHGHQRDGAGVTSNC